MENTISFTFFSLPPERKYHIYQISRSPLDAMSHSHDFYHVCYVADGKVLHTLGEDQVELNYGDAFLVPPGISHSLTFPDSQSCRIYSLAFLTDIFHEGFCHSPLARFLAALQLPKESESMAVRCRVSLDAEQRLTMNAVLESLMRESRFDYPPMQSAAPSLIASCLYVMSQAYAATPERAKKLQKAGQYTDSLEACIRYVDRNYQRPLTAEGLARQFAMSRSTFSLLFPQVAGMPLKRYLTQKRIDQATLLAETTDLPFLEIAAIVGYEDFSTFYRNFTKVTGVSPSAYRDHPTQLSLQCRTASAGS